MALGIAEGGQKPQNLQAQSQIMIDKREGKKADNYGCTWVPTPISMDLLIN
jgi:hypothetical protein